MRQKCDTEPPNRLYARRKALSSNTHNLARTPHIARRVGETFSVTAHERRGSVLLCGWNPSHGPAPCPRIWQRMPVKGDTPATTPPSSSSPRAAVASAAAACRPYHPTRSRCRCALLPQPPRTMLRRRRRVWDFICGPKVKRMAMCQTRGGQMAHSTHDSRDARAVFKANEFGDRSTCGGSTRRIPLGMGQTSAVCATDGGWCGHVRVALLSPS